MNREGFQDTIRKQYADEIQAAYVECEHEASKIDYPQLKLHLAKLMKSACGMGMTQKDFIDLVDSCLSEETRKAVGFDEMKSAA